MTNEILEMMNDRHNYKTQKTIGYFSRKYAEKFDLQM